jgi:hypothetical protein
VNLVLIDSLYNTYVSGTTLDTLPLIVTNSNGTTTSIPYGSGSIRSFLLKFDSTGMLEFYKIMTNTFINSDKDLNSCLFDLDSNNNVLFSCYVTSSFLFSSDGSSINYTQVNSGNVLIKFDSDGNKLWDVKINNIGTPDISCLSLVTHKTFNVTFLQIACVVTPTISGSSIPIRINPHGLIMKIDEIGNVKWIVSIENSPILQSRLKIDECTLNLLFSFSSDINVYFYLNGSMNYVSSKNLIILDATGKVIKYKSSYTVLDRDVSTVIYDEGFTTPGIDINDFFSSVKDPYYKPLYDGTCFEPYIQIQQPYVINQFDFVFTTMGRTGRTGPTNVTYSPTPTGWTGLSGGMQLWNVPTTGDYMIISAGAGSRMTVGSQTPGGRGAIVSTTVRLTQGHVIKLLVGQTGIAGTNGTFPQFGTGGAGGSFVYNNTTNTLILVGGGGGNPFNITSGTGGDANITTNGGVGVGPGANGGTNGNAGTNNQMGNDPNPGAGYSGNVLYTGGNTSIEPALSFINPTNSGRGCRAPGANSPTGGFGGGGSIGGGGGYSGGGGINNGQSGWGGGGGSYDINGIGNTATRYIGTLPASITTVTTPGYNNDSGFIYIKQIL